MIDGRIALTQRGPGASVDPCKWTSPAGRCDSTPSDTATRELYEELVVLSDGRPAFLTVDTSSMGSKSLYLDTLRRNGIHAGKNDLVYLDAGLPDRYRSMTATVETRFGRGDGGDVECYFGEFWPLYDPSASTLELRRIVEVTVPEDISSVSFSDGEYGQPTRLFGRDDLVNTDPDEFVRTDRALREKVIEGN